MHDACEHQSLGTHVLLAALLCFWLAVVVLFAMGVSVSSGPEGATPGIFEPAPQQTASPTN